ncbi:ATPase- ATP-binding domain protein [Rutstroemia sp. NJR-2017a WRK4]|nr:ATPase- ATP-binding domain protein [Rutstroemia sp. NJR-2017a WRK4]
MSAIHDHKPSEAAIAEARELIEKIASDYGWISPEDRAKTPEQVLRELEKRENSHAVAARRLLDKLDQSKTNFVLELIQNADDSKYTGVLPRLIFTITPTTIEIKYEEDGFTAEDVKAICGIGKSTRARSDFRYSLGDEGLGFKSVFKVASRAHIQSGPYSFFFEHNVGDTGMGLITPHLCEREGPQERGTKITLRLHKDLQFETILSHFKDLPDVLFLFTRKVKGCFVFPESAATLSCCVLGTSPLKAIWTSLRNSKLISKYYHITTRKLINLPQEGRRDRDEVEILLAFPLSFDGKPLIEEQDLYTCYPLGKFGFPFIIQSDFLESSHGKLDINNARNQAIFDGVAVAFLDAVLQFCQHPTLQYRWMRYLPKKEDGPLAFKITTQIEQLLVQTPILWSRTKGALRKICELRIVPESFKTLDGKPLLEDCQQDIDLDDGYHMDDVRTLEPLGLKCLTNQDILKRVRQDVLSTTSKFKSSETTSEWHERIAAFIVAKFGSTDITELQMFDLIPLQNGTYTDSLYKVIYFPHEDTSKIPDDLGIHIVESRAIKVKSSRNLLFRRLGVLPIDANTVRYRILERYESEVYQQWRSTLTLERSVCHLKYLYLTQKSSSGEKKDDTSRDNRGQQNSTYGMIRYQIQLFDHKSALIPRSTELYFPTENEFGIQNLASGIFNVSIINEAYFTTEPQKNTLVDISWRDWLHDNFGILYCPKLSSAWRRGELSDTVRLIANYQPGSFLGFFRTYWAQFSTQLNPGLTKTIADIEVPCEDDKLEPLHSTYLPSLERYARPYLRGERFRFLKLSPSLISDDWGFLTCFGVGITANLDFYLQVLACICDVAVLSGTDKPRETKEPERVLRLYEAIQTQFTRSKKLDQDRDKIRSFLEENRAISVPLPNQTGRSRWISPSECVWDGPENPLKVVLSSCKHVADNAVLVDFFRNTIGIPKVNFMHLIDILHWIKDHPENSDVGDISATYQQLQAHMVNYGHQEVAKISSFQSIEDFADHFSELFNEHRLVYIPAQKSWIAPEQCTWGSIAHMGGKINIDAIYPSLQNLFVDFLDVELFSVEEFIKRLARLSKTNPSIDQIKMLICEVNSRSPAPEDLQCLRHGKVFPVKTVNGTVELFSWDDDFVVVDRQDLANAFEGQLNKLDFTLEEVHGLRSFIRSLDLHHRYLSHLVSERSELLDGVIATLHVPATNILRGRAHALFRCARHFESPRTLNNNRDLYKLLLQTEILETCRIATYLSISHQGQKITVRSRQPSLFIDETTTSLRICLPRDPQQRKFSCHRALPTKIFRFLMSETSLNTHKFLAPTEFVCNAVAVINDVLCVDESMLDYVLTTAGIVQVPLQEPVKDIPKLWEDLPPSRDAHDAPSQPTKEHKLVLRQTVKEVEQH